MARRGGVAHRPEPDRLIVADQPLLAQRQRIRLARQRVQALPLGGQPHLRGGSGLAMDPGVDPVAERPAGLLELSEAAIGRQRFAPDGTRSALAILTVASSPPLDSGSDGTHVSTVQP